jgi:hypothetical protein
MSFVSSDSGIDENYFRPPCAFDCVLRCVIGAD